MIHFTQMVLVDRIPEINGLQLLRRACVDTGTGREERHSVNPHYAF